MVPCRHCDEELMRRIVGHDAHAMVELRDRFYSVLMATAVRLLRDRSDAEDVVQDVLTRVWIHAHTYDHVQGSLSTWLIQITRHRAIDIIRQHNGRREHKDHAPLRSSEINAESRMAAVRDAEVLRSALALLPDTQRALLEQAYFHGSSHSELARSFRIPLGTVKTRIRMGLAALKRGYTRGRLVSTRGPAWRLEVRR